MSSQQTPSEHNSASTIEIEDDQRPIFQHVIPRAFLPEFNKFETDDVSILKNQLRLLEDFNKERLISYQATEPRGKYLLPQVVEIMLEIAEKFNVEESVKFNALELYNRFICRQTNWLRELKKDMNKNYQEYHDSLKRRRENFILNLCSCLQLASKNYGSKRIGSLGIQQVLETTFQKTRYSISKINDSEFAVFQRLSFKLECVSPMMYVEALLPLLKLGEQGFKRIYSMCILHMELFYMEKSNLYKEFCDASRKNEIPSTRLDLYRFQGDYSFLASGIIRCSLHHSQEFLENRPERYYVVKLEQLTRISSREVAMLGRAFTNLILTTTKNTVESEILSKFDKFSIANNNIPMEI